MHQINTVLCLLGLVPTNFTHIVQAYFIDIGAMIQSYDCPSAIEVTFVICEKQNLMWTDNAIKTNNLAQQIIGICHKAA